MARRPSQLTLEQQRIVRELVRKHGPLIEDAFMASVRNAQGALDFNALVQALDNDFGRALNMLSLDRADFYPLEEAIRSTIVDAGASVTIPKTIQGTFGFNGRHHRAEQIIAEMGARLVTEIGSPGPEAIRSVILQGQQEGIGAQKIARRLAGTINKATGIREGGIIGLDGPRAERSARVREILSDPEKIKDYFKGKNPRYSRTDRRFDAKVRKAIAEGKALPKADIEKIAKLHDARLLKDRAKAIAENETFTAQAQGRNEAYRQMNDRDDVESVGKRWQHASANNPRQDHKAMDGKTIGFDEAFVMSDFARMQYPHDPAGGATHSLGCRCTVVYIPQFRRPSR